MLWPRGTRAPCDQSQACLMVTWFVSTNQRPVSRPIFIHLSSSVCCSANLNYHLSAGPPVAQAQLNLAPCECDQSEASLQVTWSASTNGKPVFWAKSGDPAPLQRRSPHPRDTRVLGHHQGHVQKREVACVVVTHFRLHQCHLLLTISPNIWYS